MKLKDGFITHEGDGEQIMVDAGEMRFAGLVRSNRTAAFIVNCLKKETDPEQITEEMENVFDAPREQIAKDVAEILKKLQSIGAIDE